MPQPLSAAKPHDGSVSTSYVIRAVQPLFTAAAGSFDVAVSSPSINIVARHLPVVNAFGVQVAA